MNLKLTCLTIAFCSSITYSSDLFNLDFPGIIVNNLGYSINSGPSKNIFCSSIASSANLRIMENFAPRILFSPEIENILFSTTAPAKINNRADTNIERGKEISSDSISDSTPEFNFKEARRLSRIDYRKVPKLIRDELDTTNKRRDFQVYFKINLQRINKVWDVTSHRKIREYVKSSLYMASDILYLVNLEDTFRLDDLSFNNFIRLVTGKSMLIVSAKNRKAVATEFAKTTLNNYEALRNSYPEAFKNTPVFNINVIDRLVSRLS